MMSTNDENGDIGQSRGHLNDVVPRAPRVDHGRRLAAGKRRDGENTTTGTDAVRWRTDMGVAGTMREVSLDTGVPTTTNVEMRDVLHATTLRLVDDARHIE